MCLFAVPHFHDEHGVRRVVSDANFVHAAPELAKQIIALRERRDEFVAATGKRADGAGVRERHERRA
jgi:catechol 2,3-dioxygenase-like lactoylglutathione lyase family enzyme